MIDHGEAILATIGVRAVLDDGPVKILAPQWADIRRTDKRIDAAARDLVNDALDRPRTPDVDYDAFLDGLSAVLDAAGVGRLLAPFGPQDHAEATAFVGQAQRALTYLRQRFPISTVTTVTGTYNVRPSDVALGLFEETFALIDRPLSIFDLVQADRLTSQLALDLMTVYPSLYVAVIGALVRRIVAQKAKDRDYEPDWERSLAVLLAVPGLPPELRSALQTPAPAATASSPPGGGAKPGEAPPSLLATPSQKLDLRN